MSEMTQVLNAATRGDPAAAENLLPLVYDELRKLAANKMAKEAAGHTLQPTALVHEAWLRLIHTEDQNFQNRAHFFAAAGERPFLRSRFFTMLSCRVVVSREDFSSRFNPKPTTDYTDGTDKCTLPNPGLIRVDP